MADKKAILKDIRDRRSYRHRTYSINRHTENVIDCLLSEAVDRGLLRENAVVREKSHLIRFAIAHLCPTSSNKDIDKALRTIENNLELWDRM